MALLGGVVGWCLSPLINRLLGGFFWGFNWLFARTINGYGRLVHAVLRVSVLALVVYVGLLGLTYWEFTTVPTGFIPPQDKGYLIVNVQLPDGASLERTDAVIQQATELVLQAPGVGNAVGFAGFSAATRANSSNAGAIFATLKPFEERVAHGLTGTRIAQDLRQRLADIQEASIAVFPPPPVRGLGTAGGFKLQVQNRGGGDLAALQAATEQLVGAARGQPGLVGVFTPFRANTPQLYADVDRTKAKMLGLPLDNVFDALQTYLGSAYVNDFNLFGRTYQVTAQAAGAFRNDPSDILRLKARNDLRSHGAPRLRSSMCARLPGQIGWCGTICFQPRRSTGTRPRGSAPVKPLRPWNAWPGKCSLAAWGSSGQSWRTSNAALAMSPSSCFPSVCCWSF